MDNRPPIGKIELKNKTYKKYMECRVTQQVSKARQSKKDYYNQYFTQNKENLQKTWKGIKEIINIKTKNHSQPTCIIDNNKTITDPKEIANSFNKYYTSIASDILKERKYEGTNSHTDYLHNPLTETFVIFECDRKEIEEIITTLNPERQLVQIAYQLTYCTYLERT